MADVNVLYLVTAVVLAGLAIWVGVSLVTAKDAPDESPKEGSGDAKKSEPETRAKKKDESRALPNFSGDDEVGSRTDETKLIQKAPSRRDSTPPSEDVAVRSERAVAIGGKSAPVVVLPPMRQRLDSHTEIRDDGSSAAAAVDEPPPMSTMPFSLVSAIGRSEPTQGPTERSEIVDRHRLFILAEGGGQRVQHELVSAVLVDGLAAAFEADSPVDFPIDPALPLRADRLRRAALGADAALKERAATDAIDLARTGLLAAHFTPDNRNLYIATTGMDRAYRLRGQDVVQLNKPGLAPSVSGETRPVEIVVAETAVDDVYVFGTDAAFLALGDELKTVLKSDASIDRVAAHFVAAASGGGGKSLGMTAIVVRVDPPRPSQRPASI